jgi:signal transduction histidine kinase
LLAEDSTFPRLVSLACHDLRTPLATVHGFARTLARSELGQPADRYVEMIEAATMQLTELLDELGLAARIAADRYEPTLRAVDTLALARGAAERLGPERVVVEGQGAEVAVDEEATARAVSALAQCALRHGGLEQVTVRVAGPQLEVEPITPASAPVVLGEDLRDLGAAVAVRVIESLGGSVGLAGDTLTVGLPTGAGARAGGP